MSWRDEIDIVLHEWIAALGGEQGRQPWLRVGTARPTGEAGVYVVDIRSSDVTADQADNLRLAGPDERSAHGGFPVMETTIEGELFPHDYRSGNLPAPVMGGRADTTRRADVGDGRAASLLADLLAARGDLYELRVRAAAGNEDAARRWPTCA